MSARGPCRESMTSRVAGVAKSSSWFGETIDDADWNQCAYARDFFLSDWIYFYSWIIMFAATKYPTGTPQILVEKLHLSALCLFLNPNFIYSLGSRRVLFQFQQIRDSKPSYNTVFFNFCHTIYQCAFARNAESTVFAVFGISFIVHSSFFLSWIVGLWPFLSES